VLRENGFSDVPRAANEQYVLVRKADEFDAVLSKKKQTFELDALKPGDLLFWTGTYVTERDPPVTHSMIYLGTQKGTGRQRVMVGSSDGRTYAGKSRWGVSVFDFQGGQTSRDPSKVGRGGFVGYATIPGIRNDAGEGEKSNAR
jgi:cell wall-associated NlpC family hydrolase